MHDVIRPPSKQQIGSVAMRTVHQLSALSIMSCHAMAAGERRNAEDQAYSNFLDMQSSWDTLKSSSFLPHMRGMCRTQKTKDLAHKDWAEICWYFPDSREQYRLLGHLTLIGKDSKDKELSEVRLTKSHIKVPSACQTTAQEFSFCKALRKESQVVGITHQP